MGRAPVPVSASLWLMSSKVDRELAEIESRRAAERPRAARSGIGASLKRIAKDLMVRRHSTKR